MKTVLVLIGIVLSGCAGPRAAEFYTKPEVDAIAARTQCRAMAKNLVQIAKCNDL